jgi:hypothetical protein
MLFVYCTILAQADSHQCVVERLDQGVKKDHHYASLHKLTTTLDLDRSFVLPNS